MKPEPKHTPMFYRINEYKRPSVYNEDGWLASCVNQQVAQQFIEACNSHDQLRADLQTALEALREALPVLQRDAERLISGLNPLAEDTLGKMDGALAPAEVVAAAIAQVERTVKP